MRPNRTFMAACVAVAASGVTWAPSAIAQSRADPADAAVRVPATIYRSPFADYRAFRDETVGNWRAANDEAGRIGGWREYARESQAPEGTDAAPGKATSKSAPKPATGASPLDTHDGHGMPGGKP